MRAAQSHRGRAADELSTRHVPARVRTTRPVVRAARQQIGSSMHRPPPCSLRLDPLSTYRNGRPGNRPEPPACPATRTASRTGELVPGPVRALIESVSQRIPRGRTTIIAARRWIWALASRLRLPLRHTFERPLPNGSGGGGRSGGQRVAETALFCPLQAAGEECGVEPGGESLGQATRTKESGVGTHPTWPRTDTDIAALTVRLHEGDVRGRTRSAAR